MKALIILPLALLCAGPALGQEEPVPEPETVTIVTTDGKTYTDAIVTGVDAVGILITTPTGPKKIAFDRLPPEDREKYGFDPKKAAAARAAQAKALANRNKAIDAQVEGLARRQAREKMIDALPVSTIEILSVLDDGVIGYILDIQAGYILGKSDVMHLGGIDTRNFVDGQHVEGKIVREGTFKYTTALGAVATVPSYRLP